MLKVSEACERNKDPILNILKDVLSESETVLEIGSGTGQHAVYFARHLTHLTWYPSDLEENIEYISERVKIEGAENVKPPFLLDVKSDPWPINKIDAVFTANTFHIMHWEYVKEFFRGAGKILNTDGLLCVYGPFKYNGNFTTKSNEDFDEWLKERDPDSGIRDFEELNKLAESQGLEFVIDHNMPANNQFLLWRKSQNLKTKINL